MNFAEPYYLYFLLPALLALIIFRSAAGNNYKNRLAKLSSNWQAGSIKEPFEWPKRILLFLSLIAIIVALARPRWDFHWAEVKHRGSDVMIVLDLSKSMMAEDIKPNRLERAKRSVRDLLQTIQSDRIGLILFSGVAFIQCPLTYDRGSFDLFLDQANVELLPVQGTEIESALNLADRAFEQGSEAGSRAKTVILISDGEDHGESSVDIAKTLKDKGIRVFTLGMGAEGSPIPSGSGSYLKDDRGQLVLSKPDLAGLSAIAKAGGGRLIRAEEGLDDFYRNELGQGDVLKSTREKVWKERHMALSLLAISFLLFEFFLSRKRLA